MTYIIMFTHLQLINTFLHMSYKYFKLFYYGTSVLEG